MSFEVFAAWTCREQIRNSSLDLVPSFREAERYHEPLDTRFQRYISVIRYPRRENSACLLLMSERLSAGRNGSITFLALPFDIMQEIMLLLDARSLAYLARACKAFPDVTREMLSIHKQLSYSE